MAHRFCLQQRLGLLAGIGLLFSLFISPSAHALQKLALTVGPDFPHLVTGELDLLYTPKWNIGINAGGLAIKYQSYPLSMEAASLRLRWHPFDGTFFFGLAGGLQRANGSASKDIQVTYNGNSVTVPTTANANLLTPYIMPYMGWFVVTRWGFTFGFEFGYQVSLGSSTGLSIKTSDPNLSQVLPTVQSTSTYQDMQSQMQNSISKIGDISLPYASLRLGWTF